MLIKVPSGSVNLLSLDGLKLEVSNLSIELSGRFESTTNDLNLATGLFRTTLGRDSEDVGWVLELKGEARSFIIDSIG